MTEQRVARRAEGGCAHDYADKDRAQARCMLCGRRGHLCCQSTTRLPALKPSCCNCGDKGHVVEECWRVRPRADLWSFSDYSLLATVSYCRPSAPLATTQYHADA